MSREGARRLLVARHYDSVMMPQHDAGMVMPAFHEQAALLRLLTDLENEARRLSADSPHWMAPSQYLFRQHMTAAVHLLETCRDDLERHAGAHASLG